MADSTEKKPSGAKRLRLKRVWVLYLFFVGVCLLASPLMIDVGLVWCERKPVFTHKFDVFWDGGTMIHYGRYYQIFDGRRSYSQSSNRFEVSVFGVTVYQRQTAPNPTVPPNNNPGPGDDPF